MPSITEQFLPSQTSEISEDLQTDPATALDQEVTEDTLNIDQAELEKFQGISLDIFLDHEGPIPVYDQLKLMSEFWAMAGYKVPTLSEDQVTMLDSILEVFPGYRVIPAPLLDSDGREELVTRFTGRLKEAVDVKEDGDWRLDTSGVYGRLLDHPEKSITEEGHASASFKYSLRYKTSGGELVSRKDYISGLKKTGQSIKGANGIRWTFPVVDVRSERKQTGRSNVSDIYAGHNPFDTRLSVSPASTTESMLAVHLLHQANRTPNYRPETDLSNESVLVDFKRDAYYGKSYLIPLGIGNGIDGRKVALAKLYTDVEQDRYGTRDAVSGVMDPRRFQGCIVLSGMVIENTLREEPVEETLHREFIEGSLARLRRVHGEIYGKFKSVQA